MGSCISKCKPKKSSKREKLQEESQCIEKDKVTSLVQDKLVNSQASISCPPPPPPLPSINKSLISCPILPPDVPSSPSFSCTNSNYPTTSSSSSSSSSSCSFLSSASSTSSSVVSSDMDRTSENLPIIGRDHGGKGAYNYRTKSSVPTRCYASGGNKPNGPKQHPRSPQRVARPAAQKRPRSSSPSNLVRQKSFRRETDKPIVSSSPSNLGQAHHQKSFRREPDRPVSRSGRDLRPISPSPSRRFKGEAMTMTTSTRRESGNVRPNSPKSINSRRYGGCKKLVGKRENNEGVLRGVGSKLEGLAIGDMLSAQEMDWMPIEDANNPHIALDCFIFL